MTSLRWKILVSIAALTAAAGLPARVAAQTEPVPPAERPPSTSVDPAVEPQYENQSWGRPVLRIGQDYTLKAGNAIRQAVVIYGTATIDGRVDDDVVVVFGKAQLSGTAEIDGSLTVIGGTAAVASGAQVLRDLIVVGGTVDAPPGFAPGGEHVVIGTAALGGRLETLVPWLTHGLLWGRLIVPDLSWVWWVAGLFFLVNLALGAVLHQPVRASAETLAEKPLTAFVVGLLVLLLTGPVCVLLAVSVIGIAVVPFVLCAIFVAWLIGRVAVARWIGMTAVREESSESRLQALRSFAIGSAVICIAYMVPVLGIATWTMIGVLGLGGATLAFMTAYRRENPRPVRRVRVDPPPPPAAYRVERTPGPAAYEDVGAAEVRAEAAAVAAGSAAAAVPPLAGADLSAFPHAPFRDRLGAFVLDVILVVIAQQLLNLDRHDSVVFLLLLVYHIGFWTWKSTTVGGIICQLRVVRVDGAPLRFADALVRGLSSIFSLAVLGIGGLWILKDPERQAWHDKIAGTYVVSVPRNWPL